MSYGSLQKLAHIIRDRRTVKMFQQKAVDQNIILDAIDIARWAPNHHVTEPWHFYLLNKVVIKKCINLIRIVATEKKGKKLGEFKAKDAASRPETRSRSFVIRRPSSTSIRVHERGLRE